jgi:hypothetical protein
MAAKRKKSAAKSAQMERPEVASDTSARGNADIVLEVRENYERGISSESENRRLLTEDLNFVFNAEDTNAQWDVAVLQARRARPSYTYNRCIQSVNMVTGDMRQVEPQIKVRAANKQSSVATATIWEGLVRGIENESRARRIYNEQFKLAVGGGYGIWRVVPEYCDDETLDQVLRIRGVPNPQTAFWNPEVQDPYLMDMQWGGFAESIGVDLYRELYPNFAPVTFSMNRDSKGWVTEKMVRIAEYFKRVKIGTKVIAQLDDGRVVDADQFEDLIEHMKEAGARVPEIKRKREVAKWGVRWWKVDGVNLLEGPITYEWKRIPIVRLPGRYVAIEGRKKCQSLIRHSKDAQRTYNLHRSTMIESAALTPRAPYLATPKMIKGYEEMWATANTANRPYLLYDPDPDAVEAGSPGRPTREPPPDVPAALVTLAQQDLGDLQASTGYFDASLGSQVNDSDRTSGEALIARQRRGDLGSFEFLDNLAGALEATYTHIIDMARTVYDTERVVRIVGPDAVEQFVKVNADPDNGQNIVYDLTKGAYDVTATVGPGYATARQDTLETLLEVTQAVPAIGQLAPDLIARNVDMPDADELARRARIPLIHQGIVKPTDEEKASLPPPPPPDPMQQAELARALALARRDTASAQVAESKANAGDIAISKMIYDAAGKHLANMVMAHRLGTDMAANLAERQVAASAQPGVPPAGLPGAPNSSNQ